jgi:phage terminase large subunit-like protein
MTTPLEVLGTLRIEDGRPWTEAAYPFQLEDAMAVLSDDPPPYSFLTRSRGASKTSDLAACALALLLAAEQRENQYWLAADIDQGRLAIDAIQGFLDRTPALRDAVIVTASAVEVRATGSKLTVLASDTASSWGLRPKAVWVDELTQWSDSPGPRRLLESVASSAAKDASCRFTILTTAGDPAHFSHAILEHAIVDERWRVHQVGGPAPWQDADALREQKARLAPSLYRQLYENEWTESEDRLVPNREDLLACVAHDGFLPAVEGARYVIGLDVGLVRDRTAAALCHAEGRAITLDRLQVWTGTKEAPVQLEHIENWITATCKSYPRTRIVLDPHQAVGLEQRLRAHGLAATQFPFTSTSVGRLATTLFNCIRERRLRLIDDEELIDELAHVRLRVNSAGTQRLDHDSGRHDDRAIALALAATTLLEDAVTPVHLDAEIAAIKERLRREARLKGKGRQTTEEAFGAGGGRTTEESLGGGPRGSWRDAFDDSLPTLGGQW